MIQKPQTKYSHLNTSSDNSIHIPEQIGHVSKIFYVVINKTGTTSINVHPNL